MFVRSCRAIVASLLAVVAAGDLAVGEEIRLSGDQINSIGIETVVLRSQQTGELQQLPAQVVIPTHQLRVVSTPLAGVVEQVLVTTQQSVRRGQLIARLQSPSLADLQHTFPQAAAQVELAQVNLDRDEKLLAAGVIAESRLQATRSHLSEVSTDLAERTQALRAAGMSEPAIARLRSGRGVGTGIELVAPIDGIVLEQLAVVGQRVEAAAPVVKMAWLEPLWLDIQVPVAKLSGIGVGAAVAVPVHRASGKVIAVGQNVVAATQTTIVRAEVSRDAKNLRPGQLVEANIAATLPDGEWSVPSAAFARIAGKPLVFVQTPGGFRPQPVRLVSEGPESSIVAGNFKGDERIAVKGVAALKAALLGIGIE